MTSGSAEVIAAAAQKGGCGKTGTVSGLASAARSRGLKPLLIDLNPQGDLTTGVGLDLDADGVSAYDLMKKTRPGSLADYIVPSGWSGVDIVRGSLDLEEVENAGDASLSWRLWSAIDGSGVREKYDYVFIDTQTHGRLLYSALTAATFVVAVVEPTAFGVRKLAELERVVEEAAQSPQKGGLRINQIVVSLTRGLMVHKDREAELREAYGDLVMELTVPYRTGRLDAHDRGIPVHDYVPRELVSKCVEAYDALLDSIPLGANARRKRR